MLEELHELLGGAGGIDLSAVVTLGAALYFYPRLKPWLPLPRQQLVRFHRWGAVLFLPLVTAHYLLAPRVHPLQPLGALGLAAAFIVGWTLRRDKRNYQFFIQAKAVLVLVAAVALVAGHLLVEHEAPEHYGRSPSLWEQAADAGATIPDWRRG